MLRHGNRIVDVGIFWFDSFEFWHAGVMHFSDNYFSATTRTRYQYMSIQNIVTNTDLTGLIGSQTTHDFSDCRFQTVGGGNDIRRQFFRGDKSAVRKRWQLQEFPSTNKFFCDTSISPILTGCKTKSKIEKTPEKFQFGIGENTSIDRTVPSVIDAWNLAIKGLAQTLPWIQKYGLLWLFQPMNKPVRFWRHYLLPYLSLVILPALETIRVTQSEDASPIPLGMFVVSDLRRLQ